MDKTKRAMSYIYICTYIFVLIAIFIGSTQVNGNPIFLANPVNNQFINTICRQIVMGSIFINLVLFALNVKYIKSNKTYIIIFILLILSVLASLFLHTPIVSSYCFLFYLFILNSNLINAQYFIRLDFILKFILISLIIIAYFLKLFPQDNNLIVMRGSISRYSLGFTYPNYLGSAVLGMILSFVLITIFKRYNIINLILFTGIIGFMFFKITDARSLRLVVIFFIISFVFLKTNAYKYILKHLTVSTIIFLLILSIAFVFMYINSLPLSEMVNKMSSSRLMYQAQAVTRFPIRLIGHNLPSQTNIYDSTKDVFLDNGFVGFLVMFGIIGTFFYEFFFIRSGYIAEKYSDYLLCLVLLAMSIQFMFEVDYDKVWMIAPLIYAFSLDYNKKSNINVTK